eukprot:TRINITY_DN17343_c0_g2_i1.p6 TRINITY_DN17343_c0_g2~~TRINITY_DN17343_c0_g2_i1.p6  ORF type:complete len:138 (+),score=1.20 TRINITY_DN17343_c0_g2_i1:503-916(+)
MYDFENTLFLIFNIFFRYILIKQIFGISRQVFFKYIQKNYVINLYICAKSVNKDWKTTIQYQFVFQIRGYHKANGLHNKYSNEQVYQKLQKGKRDYYGEVGFKYQQCFLYVFMFIQSFFMYFMFSVWFTWRGKLSLL